MKVMEKYYPYRKAGITMLVLGAGIAAGGGIGFGVAAQSQYDLYDANTTTAKINQAILEGKTQKQYLDEVNRYKDKGKAYKTTAIITGIGGGAMAVTGIILMLIPKEREVLKKMSFRVNKDGFYASLRWDF
jgi:hypothetical protein